MAPPTDVELKLAATQALICWTAAAEFDPTAANTRARDRRLAVSWEVAGSGR